MKFELGLRKLYALYNLSQAEAFLNNGTLGSQFLVKHGKFTLAMFWGDALIERCLLCTF